ncbi:FKBP-type peptidyl-prolyl cis-trans isomerase [Dyella sp. A6]|uniref:FKBP-type peptidyl-prolyl cis-trans isomerase n=1 Tax=Dyella aluminiiresistens TaxID=3069105 RepID=UPI002E75B6CA|nr:FKBP-type peptidyl-prolyl cis-trans isomerase [Dyella sp. A6]
MRRLIFASSLAVLALLATVSASVPAELVKIDTVVGKGAVAHDGDMVSVDYTGWLYDANAKDHHGKEFDSSDENGAPISFTLGAGQVITGWDQGIAGMHVGGERTLIIPANLAYGSKGSGDDIPPGATLVFDVTLISVN